METHLEQKEKLYEEKIKVELQSLNVSLLFSTPIQESIILRTTGVFTLLGDVVGFN